MANLSFKKVPEDLVWRLKIAAFRAELRFGAYCIGFWTGRYRGTG